MRERVFHAPHTHAELMPMQLQFQFQLTASNAFVPFARNVMKLLEFFS